MSLIPQQQAPPASATLIEVPDELRCKYANRICHNPRALRPDGTLHSLCEEHRARANRNQQRLRDRQRQNRLQMVPPNCASEISATEWQELLEILSSDGEGADSADGVDEGHEGD